MISGVVTCPGRQRQLKSSRHKERRCISAWWCWAVGRGTGSRDHHQSERSSVTQFLMTEVLFIHKFCKVKPSSVDRTSSSAVDGGL